MKTETKFTKRNSNKFSQLFCSTHTLNHFSLWHEHVWVWALNTQTNRAFFPFSHFECGGLFFNFCSFCMSENKGTESVFSLAFVLCLWLCRWRLCDMHSIHVFLLKSLTLSELVGLSTVCHRLKFFFCFSLITFFLYHRRFDFVSLFYSFQCCSCGEQMKPLLWANLSIIFADCIHKYTQSMNTFSWFAYCRRFIFLCFVIAIWRW